MRSKRDEAIEEAARDLHSRSWTPRKRAEKLAALRAALALPTDPEVRESGERGRRVTIPQMAAAMRDYPDAAWPHHVVAAEEVLAFIGARDDHSGLAVRLRSLVDGVVPPTSAPEVPAVDPAWDRVRRAYEACERFAMERDEKDEPGADAFRGVCDLLWYAMPETLRTALLARTSVPATPPHQTGMGELESAASFLDRHVDEGGARMQLRAECDHGGVTWSLEGALAKTIALTPMHRSSLADLVLATARALGWTPPKAEAPVERAESVEWAEGDPVPVSLVGRVFAVAENRLTIEWPAPLDCTTVHVRRGGPFAAAKAPIESILSAHRPTAPAEPDRELLREVALRAVAAGRTQGASAPDNWTVANEAVNAVLAARKGGG